MYLVSKPTISLLPHSPVAILPQCNLLQIHCCRLYQLWKRPCQNIFIYAITVRVKNSYNRCDQQAADRIFDSGTGRLNMNP